MKFVMNQLDQRLISLLLKGNRALIAASLSAVAFLVFLQLINGCYSASVDVAHHYELVNWIANHWTVPASARPLLQEMAIYPRYSHVAAALVGTLLGSSFLGMQAVAAASTALALSAIALIPRLMTGVKSWAFTLFIVLLLGINGHSFRLELFGNELLSNFFFSQMVAQACLMVVVVAASYIEKAYGAGISLIVGVLFTSIALAGIHLLPAVEGVGYGLLLLALYTVSERKQFLKRLPVCAALSVLSGLVLYKHPAFSAMREISENNGELPLNSIATVLDLCLLVSACLVVSLALMFTGRVFSGQATSSTFKFDRDNIVARHMGSAGTAIALLCVMQIVCYKLGFGSEYAYRKYAFGLSTFLIINLAMLLAQWVVQFFANSAARIKDVKLTWLQPAIILYVLWAYILAGGNKIADTQQIVQIERTANVIKSSGTVEGAAYSYARSLDVGGISDVVNYLVSVGIFEAPRDADSIAVLRNTSFPDPNEVAYILSSSNTPSVWSYSGCVKARYPNSLVVADGQCILAKFSNFCARDLDFSSAGFVSERMLTGFSHPESSGRWSDSESASFSCEYPGGFTKPTKAELTVQPFNPRGGKQILDVSVNGLHVGHFMLSDATVLTLPLPSDAVSNKSGLKFDFSIPNATSPKELGISPDGRKLGIWVSHLRLQ